MNHKKFHSNSGPQKDELVIVGALGRVGRELAKDCALRHRSILLVDVDKEELRRSVHSLQAASAASVELFVLQEDAEDPGRDITKFLQDTKKQPHHLVNAAYPGKNFFSRGRDETEIAAVHAEFVKQHFNFFLSVTSRFSHYLTSLDGGSITNFSSMYGSVSPRFEVYEGTEIWLPVGYVSAKAAVESMSRYFAALHRTSGVRVNCVAPGGIESGQPERFLRQYGHRTASENLLQSGDVVGITQLLSSEAGRAITGQTILVDDGFSLS